MDESLITIGKNNKHITQYEFDVTGQAENVVTKESPSQDYNTYIFGAIENRVSCVVRIPENDSKKLDESLIPVGKNNKHAELSLSYT